MRVHEFVNSKRQKFLSPIPLISLALGSFVPLSCDTIYTATATPWRKSVGMPIQNGLSILKDFLESRADVLRYKLHSNSYTLENFHLVEILGRWATVLRFQLNKMPTQFKLNLGEFPLCGNSREVGRCAAISAEQNAHLSGTKRNPTDPGWRRCSPCPEDTRSSRAACLPSPGTSRGTGKCGVPFSC